MKINTKIRYGIRTMLELALVWNTKALLQKDIAENQEISLKYLDQIIASLKAAGLVTRISGKNGGYTLSRNPEQISTYDIYRAFDAELLINDCLLDTAKYEQKNFCSVLDFWEGLNSSIIKHMESVSLASLSEKQAIKNKETELMMYYI